MKIEFKNFKMSLAHSEETILFSADIAINGKVVAFAKNDGRGGCTDYQAYQTKTTSLVDARKILQDAEEYCKNLKGHPASKMCEEIDIQMNFEHYLDYLVEEKLKEYENKKIQKLFKDCIVWGVPNSSTYTRVKFKKPLNEIPLLQLQVKVKTYKKGFKKGEVFFNTNFDELGIKV